MSIRLKTGFAFAVTLGKESCFRHAVDMFQGFTRVWMGENFKKPHTQSTHSMLMCTRTRTHAPKATYTAQFKIGWTSSKS